MSNLVETIERDGRRINVYDNGMERDASNGHFITPPTGSTITAENASVYVRRRMEKKRARAIAGANAAVARLKDEETGEPVWENPQDMDFIEALSEAQTTEALAGGAYASKAAEVVIRLTGMDERTQAEEPIARSVAQDVANLTALIELVREVVLPREIVEGKVNE